MKFGILKKKNFRKDQELIVERLFAGEDNPTLVIHRLLNTSEKEEEEWRQAKKFHTRVTVEDKSANLIIDTGSE